MNENIIRAIARLAFEASSPASPDRTLDAVKFNEAEFLLRKAIGEAVDMARSEGDRQGYLRRKNEEQQRLVGDGEWSSR